MALHKAEKRYVTHMVVEGTGSFPIDMLRYDRCVPESESDAAEIARLIRYESDDKPKRIALLRFGANPYQIEGESRMEYGRWLSFGWRVVSERR
jgi:hypothetical protein